MTKESVYELLVTPEEVKSLASAVSCLSEDDKEGNQASASLRRKVTALLAYVEAEARAEAAEDLYRETLEADKDKFIVKAF